MITKEDFFNSGFLSDYTQKKSETGGEDADVFLIRNFGLAIHAYRNILLNHINWYAEKKDEVGNAIDGRYEAGGVEAYIKTIRVLHVLECSNQKYSGFTVSELAVSGGILGLMKQNIIKPILEKVNLKLYVRTGLRGAKVELPNYIDAGGHKILVTDIASSVSNLITDNYTGR